MAGGLMYIEFKKMIRRAVKTIERHWRYMWMLSAFYTYQQEILWSIRILMTRTHHLQRDQRHCSGVIMSAMASQITRVSTVWLTVCSGADQRKHQSFALLAFVRGIHRWSVDSPHKEWRGKCFHLMTYVIMVWQLSYPSWPWRIWI